MSTSVEMAYLNFISSVMPNNFASYVYEHTFITYSVFELRINTDMQ